VFYIERLDRSFFMSHRYCNHLEKRAADRRGMMAWLVFSMAIVTVMLGVGRLHAQSKNYDNFGKEFYVAYGPNLGGNEGTNVMDLYITSHVPANVSVEVPALNFFKSFTTIPGQITTIMLPNGRNGAPTVELSEDLDEQVIHGMAVHITSDSAVAVFGLNHKLYSSDAFMGLPINVLGTEYRTMNYNTSSDGFGDPLTPGEFWVVAVNDSTNVTITLKDVSSLGTRANTPINVRLNKGDIYLIEGGEQDESNDLTGSLIESDQPIAVFSGHRRTAIPDTAVNFQGVPSRDHLVEQLPPVSAWGDSALVVPYATSALPDLVRVVCAEDGTQLSVNGTPVPGTFNAGDFYEITHLQGVTSIQASNPIEVGQYMHTSLGANGDTKFPAYGDPALALVFPVEQFTNAYTIVSIIDANSFSGNFVNIVADASSIGSMMIDGIPMNAGEFIPIPNTRFAYAQHSLVQGTHTITGAKPFGVTVYALGPVDSYAYTGGTLLKTITPLKTVGLVIDFGDRVLSAANLVGPGYPGGTFDTTVILQNVSEDTVNIYSFPKRIQDTDRFNVDSTSGGLIPPLGSGLPLTIAPLTTDVFRIQFHPHELGRRMHTQITAKTDHLRAYVVDVYGRGVNANMGIFIDTNKTKTIDTLDFGIFGKTDPPGDSEVYVGNAGLDSMRVTSVLITAHSPAGIFTQTGTSYRGGSVTSPFSVAASPSGPARIGIQFTPTGQNVGFYSDSLIIISTSIGDTTKNGAPVWDTVIVVLLGRVDVINALAPDTNNVTWGVTRVCDDSVFNIQINNPNDLPITITSANIIGVNPSDFAVSTRTPLVIPPGQTGTIQVNFLPTGRGPKTAQAVLTYNLPKKAPIDTVNLAGTGDKLTLELGASQNVHAYVLDNFFLMPIYAKSDLTPYRADGYHIYVHYDSVNLTLLDVVTAGTLTPFGYLSIQSGTASRFNKHPGYDTINFQQGGEGSTIPVTPFTGGGPGSTPAPYGLPLIYLKFHANTTGVDPLTFQKGFPINFTVTFDDAVIPYTCSDHVFDSGYAVVGPVCDTQFLEQRPVVPSAMMLGSPTPNPSNEPITVQYDVVSIGNEAPTFVTIDLVNAQGNRVATLVNDNKQPGYYTATIDPTTFPSGLYYLRMAAGNYQRVRNLVIQK
jgi:hypothetical protein